MVDYRTNIFADIKQYRNLIKEQKEEIEKREIIVDSLMDSMIQKVKYIILPYSEKMLHAAWIQQNKPTKKEREMYEFIKKDLFERLFDKEYKEVKLENIMPLGFDYCSYSFYFTYKGIKFELSIPNVKAANKENIYYMWYGMYALQYEKRNRVYDHIVASYGLDDIAQAIQEFVKEKTDERN